MGEFAEAAERVVTASEEASAIDDVAADSPSTPETPDPASPEPAPSAPAEASASTPSEDSRRRGPDGRFARWKSPASQRYQELANQNRTFKEENERLKRLEQDFGWLKPEQAPVLRSFYERFQADPVGALAVEALHYAQHSPEARERFKQQFAEWFADTQAQEQAKPDPEPQPDYVTDDGEAVYSAKRQAEWMAWRERQLKAEIQKEIAPLKAVAEKAQQQEVYARLSQQADATAKSVVAPLMANPLFVQHKPAIHAKYREYMKQAKAQGREIDGEVALYRAFNDVLQTVTAQSQSAQARSVAASLQAKPGASALNPARPVASAAAPRPTSFGEAAKKVLGVR